MSCASPSPEAADVLGFDCVCHVPLQVHPLSVTLSLDQPQMKFIFKYSLAHQVVCVALGKRDNLQQELFDMLAPADLGVAAVSTEGYKQLQAAGLGTPYR